MTLFDRIALRANRQFERAFGEKVTLRPMTRGPYGASADASRSVRVDIMALIDLGDGSEALNGNQAGRGATFASHVVDGEVIVSFAADLFATPDDLPRKGDEIEATAMAGSPKFVIARPGPRDGGRINFYCDRIGAAPP